MELEKSLTRESMNQRLLAVTYAVRGPLLQRADRIEREMAKGVEKPFSRVVRANVGDCHALGQRPITFIRQGSVGAYSPASGLGAVRGAVARYLARRDRGVGASPADVHLGSGASDLIRAVLTLFASHVAGKPPAVMIPIPQYPLFSGTLAELGVAQAPYYLDESRGWALTPRELRRCWRAANEHHAVRALVVINPGNPTGQVLTRHNIEEIIKFAQEHNVFILADEVYQENIVSKPFHSFKKVMAEMGSPYSEMELGSFATVSKGWAAECGLRAGWVELARLQPAVRRAFCSARALTQCPSVLGQCVLHCVVQTPSPGDASYDELSKELQEIKRTLTERTKSAYETFNSIPGYFCNVIDGSMFAFPRVEIPKCAQLAAEQENMSPDEFYCLRLLEETGVCVVPGSGFGQQPGTFHFRTTILHPRHELQHMMDSIRSFHLAFLQRYS